MSDLALGIDVGGTGIKGALVDTRTGTLLSERIKYPTPPGGEPQDVFQVIGQIVQDVGEQASGLPLGVCVPSVVQSGVTTSAANISDTWIGLHAEAELEAFLGRGIVFLNDADAAGVAEAHYGEARNEPGLTIVTTLGTGIGSAFLYDGELLPNTELGHLEFEGREAESFLSAKARERNNTDWEVWAKGLERFYRHLIRIFSPALILVGGGVSKTPELFMPHIDLPVPIRVAGLQNNAGILGAAFLAHATREVR